MSESARLVAARERLSRAEAQYRSKAGLVDLAEGLALLEEVIAGEPAAEQELARNLASAYATRIHRAIRRQIDEDPALPEPELEHLFQVLLAFDQGSVELPVEASATKVKLARSLVELYYEGHSPEAKRAALEQLAAVTGRGGGSTRRAAGRRKPAATSARGKRARKNGGMPD